jgi:hypothetical protein
MAKSAVVIILLRVLFQEGFKRGRLLSVVSLKLELPREGRVSRPSTRRSCELDFVPLANHQSLRRSRRLALLHSLACGCPLLLVCLLPHAL